VFGDRIYVTTAYTAMTGVLLQDALRLLTLGLLLSLTVLGLRVVEHRCHPVRSPAIRDFVAAISVMTVVLLLAIIGCFGDALFDFARSSMRAWMASTVFASLCLALTAAGMDHNRPRLAIALSAIAFAAFALAAFPSPGYAFRGGLPSLRMQISIAASALPLLVGVVVALVWSARSVPVSIRRAVTVAVALGVIVSAALLVRHLLVFHEESVPDTTYARGLSRRLQ